MNSGMIGLHGVPGIVGAIPVGEEPSGLSPTQLVQAISSTVVNLIFSTCFSSSGPREGTAQASRYFGREIAKKAKRARRSPLVRAKAGLAVEGH